MKKLWAVVLSIVVLAFLLAIALTAAQGRAVEPVESVVRDMVEAEISGPADISLGDQAVLHLPQHLVYAPEPQAGRMLVTMGYGKRPYLVGAVLPIDYNGGDDDVDYDNGWLVRIEYRKTGYITDSDAGNWNADAMLKRFQEQVAQDNQERRAQGLPEMRQSGWVEKPRYDAAGHRLTWSMYTAYAQSGTENAAGMEISYNTVVLGREGYIWLELLNDKEHVAGQKPLVETMLDGMRFLPGKRYEDFNAATDKTAADGLMTQPIGSDDPSGGWEPGGLLVFRSVYDKIIVGATGLGAVGMVIYAAVKKWRRRNLLKRLSGNWRK